MPVFRLGSIPLFPPPHLAEPNGLLAVGGDLSPQRLLIAYRSGIFPWYSEGTPILWWSPDPRLVLFPSELKVSRSLRRVVKRGIFEIRVDTCFDKVIEECANVRREKGEDTWIVPEMVEAYCRLHKLGYAHCVEAWHDGKLVGGLYGIALGGVFFGESMFTRESNASKVALVSLVCHLYHWNYQFIDCQVTTQHLKRFGAREIPRSVFLTKLENALKTTSVRGRWKVLPRWQEILDKLQEARTKS